MRSIALVLLVSGGVAAFSMGSDLTLSHSAWWGSTEEGTAASSQLLLPAPPSAPATAGSGSSHPVRIGSAAPPPTRSLPLPSDGQSSPIAGSEPASSPAAEAAPPAQSPTQSADADSTVAESSRSLTTLSAPLSLSGSIADVADTTVSMALEIPSTGLPLPQLGVPRSEPSVRSSIEVSAPAIAGEPELAAAAPVEDEPGLMHSLREGIASWFGGEDAEGDDPDSGTTLAQASQIKPPSIAAAGDQQADQFDDNTSQSTPGSAVGNQVQAVVVDATSAVASGSAPASDDWTEITIRRGDNLAKIFDRNRASRGDLQRIIDLGGEAGKLTSIHPGQQLRLQLSESGRVDRLEYPIDELRTLHVDRDENRFTARVATIDTEIREQLISARIKNSLYLSAQEAGLSEGLIMELAGIFGWDIDFALDLRTGDYFTVIYEELHARSGKIKDGSILAAEFVNQGKSFRAVRYTDPGGTTSYYNPDGRSMRKAFLRSPVDFRRISSRFQRERWHPVLGKKRPHRGVDYAAATGTPIRASGDGRIAFVGYKGGYGKTIVIQHGTRYSTLYGHLNGYRKGIRSGKYVKQGQTIGYVGSTGLATGPHLHYEFRVNGVHRNPLTVELPAAEPIPARYRKDFLARSKPLLATIERHASTLLARN